MTHITADALVGALRSEGLRVTRSRRAVCEVIATSHREHLTALDVQEKASRELGAALDRSTVYRTLEALETAGVIRHGHFGQGPTVYHLAEERRHQHLICRACGRTISIPEGDLADLMREITHATGFVTDVEHFALSGRCAQCAADVAQSDPPPETPAVS
jgi:Fur family ferric uptake transcriptional regulator